MFGCYSIENSDSSAVDSNGRPLYSLCLGVKNSIDKSLACSICFGAKIIVSEANVFSGEIAISKKHTKNIMKSLDAGIHEALSHFEVFKAYQAKLFGDLTTTFIEDNIVHDVVIKSAKMDALPYSWIKKIIQEWENPTYATFNRRSAWSLLNTILVVAKSSFEKNPIVASQRTILLTSLFNQEFVVNARNPNAVGV